jgi:hypothetical protein
MAGKGGGTSFDGMSHEQMLAWLDQANSGTVQAAADKLVAAAKEIRKIAAELKIRPQWVEWKGEGADAFRTWAGDLANSTLRLADFSDDSAKWLSQASDAIATAKVSIPRDMPSASTNLAAAKANHNDPDAAAVASKSTAEMEALKANREKVRQEAAAEMRKLAQAYDVSATQMNSLERPKFPPPPASIGYDEGTRDLARPGTGGTGGTGGTSGGRAVSGAGDSGGTVTGHALTPGRSSDVGADIKVPVEHHRPVDIDRPTHVEIDSVDTLPETRRPVTPGPGPVGPTTPARPDAILPPPTTGVIPPTSTSGRGGGRVPTVSGGGGKSITGGRTPFAPGQGGTNVPRGRGITGGGGFPNGPTSGTSTGRTFPGQGLGAGRNVPSASGTAAGRPTAPGVMGGRPTGPGVAGGRPTGPGVTGARPAGPGVTGGRPAGPGVTGGRPASQGIAAGRPTSAPATGRGSGRLPGGTVVGGESAANRSSTGRPPTAGPTGPSTASRPGGTGNPGRPMSTPQSGVVGGAPQQTGRAPARPGAPVPSAPTRGGISGGTPNHGGGSGRRAAGSTSGAQQGKRQQDDRRNTSSSDD